MLALTVALESARRHDKAIHSRTFHDTALPQPLHPDNTSKRVEHHSNDQTCSVIAQLRLEKDTFTSLRYVGLRDMSPEGEPGDSDKNRKDGKCGG